MASENKHIQIKQLFQMEKLLCKAFAWLHIEHICFSAVLHFNSSSVFLLLCEKLRSWVEPAILNIQRSSCNFIFFIFSSNKEGSRYLARCSMTSCLENSCYGNVEEEQYSWVHINWPIMIGIKVEVIGRGAVSWYNDVLQTKESTEE